MSRLLSTKLSVITTITVLFIAIMSGCQNPSEEWESFGEEIAVEDVPKTASMLQQVSIKDTTNVKFVGEIEEVCQMKGCWMTLKSENGERIRVTFKDYGFFVPKDAAGREVIIDGLASLSELDEETARHYADDAGREFDAAKDLKEVSIVASGVLIKKPAQL